MIVAGSPFLENWILKTSTVCSDVVVFIFVTSAHFEQESTKIIVKNMAHRKGPAKSMWTLNNCLVGQSQAFSGGPLGDSVYIFDIS